MVEIIFTCSKCNYACDVTQGLPHGSDAAEVQCGRCHANHIQCCHCSYNICRDDPQTKAKCANRRKSPMKVFYQEHIKPRHHQESGYKELPPKKRRRTSPPILWDFTCCRCSHVCTREDQGDDSRILWETISNSDQIAEVHCPGCRQTIVQCCQCPHNINPHDDSIVECCDSERRTPAGYMKKVILHTITLTQTPLMMEEEKIPPLMVAVTTTTGPPMKIHSPVTVDTTTGPSMMMRPLRDIM